MSGASEWVEHNCLQKAWAVLLLEYDEVVGIDWQWQSADGCIVKAPLLKKGPQGEAAATGRNPTDRGKASLQTPSLDRWSGSTPSGGFERSQPT